MGVQLSKKQFNSYLEELKLSYRIFAPKITKGKGAFAETNIVGYGEISSIEEIEFEEKSFFSPKEIFYPIRETLFYFKDEDIQVPSINIKPIIILGRPCDLNGIDKLDTIFLKNGELEDYYYKRRRELVKFIMIECTTGFDNCFCVSLNSNVYTNYSSAIKFSHDTIEMEIKDNDLETSLIKELNNIDFQPDYIQENKINVTIPPVDEVTKDTFNNDLWIEYTSRCIGCGRCNTSCISCSCYTMQDTKLSDDNRIGERRRVWASCHVDGYTDMAGGHVFRDKEGQRMRFKTMHKINDYYKRFGEHMCVGCGRCDDVCPEYISFSTCINKLNEIVKEEKTNE